MTSSSANKKQAVSLFIFDLDGTLIDSRKDIVCAVNTTLKHYGKEPLGDDEITRHVGRGVAHLVRKTLNTNEKTFQEAQDFLLQTYLDHCVDQTRLYPGTRDLLFDLKSKRKQLAVCTNKPFAHAKKTIDSLEIAPFFNHVIGGDSLPTKKPGPEGIQTILAAEQAEPNDAVMIGDSEVDIRAGKRAGVVTCACTYGLRPASELEPLNPDYSIDSLPELMEYFV